MNKESAIRIPQSAIARVRNPRSAIIGGGPAGSSLAIRLARSGHDVTLIERERFPRPKLCGEFISPECLRHFEALGVSDAMLGSGGEHIRETRFYDKHGRSIRVPSKWFNGDGPALSLSRAAMDEHLLRAAQREGVKVLEDTIATRVIVNDGKVEELHCRNADGETRIIEADIFIDATGRSAVMKKLITRSTGESDPPGRPKLVAFKAHLQAENITHGRCEIYSFDGGYGGLSPVEDGLANLCFMVGSETARAFGGDAGRLMSEVVCRNPQAKTSLMNAEVKTEWLAVAIQGFGRKVLQPAENVFSIGDAAGFIDPFTGSGILMALESSGILAECMNEASLASVASSYERRYKERFRTRLRLCSILRHAAFHPMLATAAISILSISESTRELIAKRTRGEYMREN